MSDAFDPASFIARFRQRRLEFTRMEFSDQELLDGLRHLRAQMIAGEISNAFKPQGINFVNRCISYLKTEQYKPEAKKPRLVPKTKLDLYPDK